MLFLDFDHTIVPFDSSYYTNNPCHPDFYKFLDMVNHDLMVLGESISLTVIVLSANRTPDYLLSLLFKLPNSSVFFPTNENFFIVNQSKRNFILDFLSIKQINLSSTDVLFLDDSMFNLPDILVNLSLGTLIDHILMSDVTYIQRFWKKQLDDWSVRQPVIFMPDYCGKTLVANEGLTDILIFPEMTHGNIGPKTIRLVNDDRILVTSIVEPDCITALGILHERKAVITPDQKRQISKLHWAQVMGTSYFVDPLAIHFCFNSFANLYLKIKSPLYRTVCNCGELVNCDYRLMHVTLRGNCDSCGENLCQYKRYGKQKIQVHEFPLLSKITCTLVPMIPENFSIRISFDHLSDMQIMQYHQKCFISDPEQRLSFSVCKVYRDNFVPLPTIYFPSSYFGFLTYYFPTYAIIDSSQHIPLRGYWIWGDENMDSTSIANAIDSLCKLKPYPFVYCTVCCLKVFIFDSDHVCGHVISPSFLKKFNYTPLTLYVDSTAHEFTISSSMYTEAPHIISNF